MTLQKVTNDVLRTVEEVTGKPVIVQPDPSLGTVLAKVTMARGSAPAHVVTYNPSASEVDYGICLQCGYLLRTFQTPESERFSLAGTDQGRKVAERLMAEHLRKSGLALPRPLYANLLEQLFGGVIQQLRSMPIGLRVDVWIQNGFPELATQQKKSLARQLNDNTTSLRPEVHQIAPAEILKANVSMNAGMALFWSRAWNDSLLAVPYKASGYLATGEELLKLFDSIPDDPANDKKLIDAWGKHAGLTGWYEFVPYE